MMGKFIRQLWVILHSFIQREFCLQVSKSRKYNMNMPRNATVKDRIIREGLANWILKRKPLNITYFTSITYFTLLTMSWVLPFFGNILGEEIIVYHARRATTETVGVKTDITTVHRESMLTSCFWKSIPTFLVVKAFSECWIIFTFSIVIAVKAGSKLTILHMEIFFII